MRYPDVLRFPSFWLEQVRWGVLRTRKQLSLQHRSVNALKIWITHFLKLKIRLQLSNSKLLKKKLKWQKQLYSKNIHTQLPCTQPRYTLMSYYLLHNQKIFSGRYYISIKWHIKNIRLLENVFILSKTSIIFIQLYKGAIFKDKIPGFNS